MLPYKYDGTLLIVSTGCFAVTGNHHISGIDAGDFSLAPPYPFVQLEPLIHWTEKAAWPAGRMPAGQQTHRLVPLSDTRHISQVQTMVATLKIPMERRNKQTGRTEKTRLWEVTDRTIRTWIGEAVAADGVI